MDKIKSSVEGHDRESMYSQDSSLDNYKTVISTPYRNPSVLLGVQSRVNRRNQILRNNQHVTAPFFWFHFREYLTFIVIIVLAAGFLVPWFTPAAERVNKFFLAGAIVSIISTVFVVSSYIHVIPWRRHPSTLLLLRAITNFFFSLMVILNVARLGRDGDPSCEVLTFMNQFLIIAGEVWVFTIAIDLKTSITNPFSNYKSNMAKYHYLVWIFSFVNASILLSQKTCQRVSTEGFCWLNADHNSIYVRSCLWGFFLCWVVAFYLVALLVICISHRRLLSGLESTYQAREAVIFDTFRVVFCFLAYAILVVFLYLLQTFIKEKLTGLHEVLSYAFGCRGFFDAVVWFYLHDFRCLFADVDERVMDDSSFYRRIWKTPRRRAHNSMQAPLLSRAPTETSTIDGIRDSSTSGTTTEALPLVASDLDLTPQLNLELRKEVIHFVTEGIKETIRRWDVRAQAMGSASGSDRNSLGTQSPAVSRECSMEAGVPLSKGNLDWSGDDYIPVDDGVLQDAMAEDETAVDDDIEEEDGDVFVSATTRQSHAFGGKQYKPVHNPLLSSGIASTNRESILSNPYEPTSGVHRGSMAFGNSFHSILHLASGLLGRHAPGEYGEDTTAQLFNFTESNTAGKHVNTGHSVNQNQPVDSKKPTLLSHEVAAANGELPHAPAEVVFDLDDKHRFRDFRPATFQTLRILAGISDSWYLQQLSQPAKEQITEGASNAFLFYAGGLIVKTVTATESRVLLSILDSYREHLRTNPDSLLVRFFGLHSLTFYGKEFIFVVMRNIFPIGVIINERFDIKGSWVNRNVQLPPPGKHKICRHCSAPFVVGGTDKCPEIVGLHEANVVFKDNDLSSKIRLKPEDAYMVIDALNKDSDALCAMGITDYSLLIGIKNQQYDVEALSPSGMVSSSTATGGGYSTISSNPLVNGIRRSFAPSTHSVSNAISISNISRARKQALPVTSTSVSETDRETTVAFGDDELWARASTNTMVAPGLQSSLAVSSLQKAGLDTALPQQHMEPPVGVLRGLQARAVVAPAVYYLGVVDILQTWSIQKQIERFSKVNLRCQHPDGVSCLPPIPYKKRFQKKISQIVEHSIFVREITGSWKGQRVISEPSPLLAIDNSTEKSESVSMSYR